MQKKELPFKRISIEMSLLHIIRSKKRVSIDTLVKKLTELQHNAPIEKQQPAAPQPVSAPETIEIVPEKPAAPPMPPPSIPAAGKEQSGYDTLLRFAAVELEGTLI